MIGSVSDNDAAIEELDIDLIFGGSDDIFGVDERLMDLGDISLDDGTVAGKNSNALSSISSNNEGKEVKRKTEGDKIADKRKRGDKIDKRKGEGDKVADKRKREGDKILDKIKPELKKVNDIGNKEDSVNCIDGVIVNAVQETRQIPLLPTVSLVPARPKKKVKGTSSKKKRQRSKEISRSDSTTAVTEIAEPTAKISRGGGYHAAVRTLSSFPRVTSDINSTYNDSNFNHTNYSTINKQKNKNDDTKVDGKFHNNDKSDDTTDSSSYNSNSNISWSTRTSVKNNRAIRKKLEIINDDKINFKNPNMFFPFMPLPKQLSMKSCVRSVFPKLESVCAISGFTNPNTREKECKRNGVRIGTVDKNDSNKVIDGNVDISANEIANSMNSKAYCINSEKNINEVLLTLFHRYIGVKEDCNPQNENIYHSNNSTHSAPDDLSISSFRKAKVNKESLETACLEVLHHIDREELQLELFCLLSVVRKQSRFLQQSLKNLHGWCDRNFSDVDANTHGVGDGRNFSLTGKINTTDATNKDEVNMCNDRAERVPTTAAVGVAAEAIGITSTPIVKNKILKRTISVRVYTSAKDRSKDYTRDPLIAFILSPSSGEACYNEVHLPISSKDIPSTERGLEALPCVQNDTLVLSTTSEDLQPDSNVNINYKTSLTVSDTLKAQTPSSNGKDDNRSKVGSGSDNTTDCYPYSDRPDEEENRFPSILCSQIASSIEDELSVIHQEFNRSLVNGQKKREEIIKNNKLTWNTRNLWDFTNTMPYWLELTEGCMTSVLSELWGPEMFEHESLQRQCNYKGELLSLPRKGGVNQLIKNINYGDNSNEQQVEKDTIELTKTRSYPASPSPLFDRLQSLLVEVGVEENDHDCTEQNDADDNSESMSLINVSELSLDQRTYIQLRAVQLIGQPTNQPTLVDDIISNTIKKSSPNCDSGEDYYRNSYKGDGDTLKTLIHQKQRQLENENIINNQTVSFLQSAAITYISKKKYKQIEEENNLLLILKHKQLVERNTEVRNKAEKNTKKDLSSWLPW